MEDPDFWKTTRKSTKRSNASNAYKPTYLLTYLPNQPTHYESSGTGSTVVMYLRAPGSSNFMTLGWPTILTFHLSGSTVNGNSGDGVGVAFAFALAFAFAFATLKALRHPAGSVHGIGFSIAIAFAFIDFTAGPGATASCLVVFITFIAFVGGDGAGIEDFIALVVIGTVKIERS